MLTNDNERDAALPRRVFRHIAAIADQAGDSEQDRLEHRFLILAGTLMSGGGLLWGTIAAGSGLWQHSLVPFGYVVVTVINFVALARWKRFATARRVQVAASILLPFLFQWVLGGFAASGGMMYWGMVGLVGSLSFDDVPTSLRLLVLYVALVITSATIDALALLPIPDQLGGRGLGSVFVGMNFVVVSSIVFFLMLYFVRSRHEAHQALMARNAELAASTARAEDASRKADAANEARGRFLAVVSHEMRTPLHGMLGLTNLVLDTELDERQRELLAQAHLSAETLAAIINDVLDFSKIEAGGVTLESIPFRLDDVLHRLTSSANLLAAKRGVEFVLEVADVPPTLIGDPTRLGQVMLNLVSNAVKFTEAGEVHVRLDAHRLGDATIELQVDVRDTGVGIARDDIDRLFRPFEQADDSTTRRFGGTGLGLSICRAFVEMMGGDMWVTSELGIGSTFSFTARLGFEPASDRAVPQELACARALVVDDNESARQVLLGYLASFEVDADAVPSAEDALRAVEDRAYGVVFADLKMPGMDGIELIRRLRRHPNTSDARLVLVTAFGSRSDEEEAERAGADGFLSKPLRPSMLLDRLLLLFSRGPSAELDVATPRKTTAEAIRGARVLVVEDNDINREILVSSLRNAGIHVEIAVDGQQGLDRAVEAGGALDLILMDLQMPNMDGLEATRRIRARGVRTPIIGVTANALAEARSSCMEAGMNEVMTKPIHMELLFTMMIRAIGRGFVPRTAPASPPGVPADVPEIAGVDTADGLARAGGDVALYLDLVRRFAQRHVGSADAIRERLAVRDLDGAGRVAHTLKGVSGNIGANAVYEASTALQRAIAEGDAARVDDLLDRVGAELGRIEQSIPVPIERAPVGILAAACDDADVAELTELMRQGSPDAVEQFEVLRHALAARWGEPVVASLAQAVDGFDFERALAILEQETGT